MAKKYRSEAMAAIHETAADLHRAGGMDQGMMRKFDALCFTPIQERTRKGETYTDRDGAPLHGLSENAEP